MTNVSLLKIGASRLNEFTSKLPHDGLLIIGRSLVRLQERIASNRAVEPFLQDLVRLHDVDASARTSPCLLAHPQAPGGRVIFAPFKGLTSDYDDARCLFETARASLKRAKEAGISKPLVYLVMPTLDLTPEEEADPFIKNKMEEQFRFPLENLFLGLMAEAYEPLQAREFKGKTWFKSIDIATMASAMKEYDASLKVAQAIGSGVELAKDLGGSDPERMTPKRFAEYLHEDLKKFIDDGTIKMEVISSRKVIEVQYPLLNAVARASYVVERHHPCVVRLEYRPKDQSKVKNSLLFSGKGVTYDTGGLDIKFDGVMRGMSRDKCGASGVAGFVKSLAMLDCKTVNVTALLGLVRNSCGADGYVSDEIIVARNGTRVLVANTDAEGRMVMTDLLCQLKEEALRYPANHPNPSLVTVATLTGHAVRAVGPYGIVLGNPAADAAKGPVKRLAASSGCLSDPFERSSLRREDFEFVAPGAPTEDVVQANDKASSATARGHQFPAAFMAIASGVSQTRLPYVHLDIAGSAEESHGNGLSLAAVTGSPVPALVAAFALGNAAA